MSDPQPASARGATTGLSPTEFPIPFGIEAESGNRLPGITEADLQNIDGDRTEVMDRSERNASDHLAISDIDPNNLEESGWCVLFAKDADPQLAYYEIGIRRMWKDVERVELIWHFLRFDHSIVSTRTADQLNQLGFPTRRGCRFFPT